MRTIALLTKVEPEETGTDLLAEFQQAVASIATRVEDREYVVEERLRVLEAEQATLKQVRAGIVAVGPAVDNVKAGE